MSNIQQKDSRHFWSSILQDSHGRRTDGRTDTRHDHKAFFYFAPGPIKVMEILTLRIEVTPLGQ